MVSSLAFASVRSSGLAVELLHAGVVVRLGLLLAVLASKVHGLHVVAEVRAMRVKLHGADPMRGQWTLVKLHHHHFIIIH